MRSKKSRRKNKPLIKVLIIFGKGITTTLSTEMVMLFLRSGFSIYPIFTDEADEWIAPNVVQQLTGRTPFSNSVSPALSAKYKIVDELFMVALN